MGYLTILVLFLVLVRESIGVIQGRGSELLLFRFYPIPTCVQSLYSPRILVSECKAILNCVLLSLYVYLFQKAWFRKAFNSSLDGSFSFASCGFSKPSFYSHNYTSHSPVHSQNQKRTEVFPQKKPPPHASFRVLELTNMNQYSDEEM